MRLLLIVTVALVPVVAGAQRRTAEAERATRSYRIGWDLMHIEDWQGAAQKFQEAIDIDPKFALAYYSLGRAQTALHKFPRAIAAYLKCRDLYLARVGEQFSNQMEANKYRDDQILEVQEAIRQANAKSTQSQTTSLYQQHLRGQLRLLEEAKNRNAAPMSIEPRVPFFVSLALGSAYFRSEHFAEAEREYKAAIDENPRYGEAYNNLAVLYMMTGRLFEAEQSVQAAEKTGFRVPSGLKEDIRKAKAATADR
jgi:superkiller protein 3